MRTVIGDHLYIVNGTNRCALYDLKKEIITLIDKKSAYFLIKLSKIQISSNKKKNFIQNTAKLIWNKVLNLDIYERLFEIDTSIYLSNFVLDLLWLEITETCNEKCSHCYGNGDLMKKNSMSISFAKNIIKQGSEAKFVKLQFTGGEPLMHKNLWEVVEYARRLYYKEIEIYTNLTLLKEKDIQRIKELNLKIATSLLGHDSKLHDLCTKTPGSFECWYRNIKHIQSLNIPYRIGVVRTKQNEHAIIDIEKFLRSEKLIAQNEAFSPDDIRQVGRGTDNKLLPDQFLDYELCLIIKPKFFHQSRQYNPCWRGEVAVATNGNVYPCVFSRDITVGNLKNETLTKILKRLKKTYWSITLDQVDKCRDCEFRYACMDCRSLSITNNKGLFGEQVRCTYDPYKID